jgi:probable HAF family extracellular repeat protein
MTKSPSNNRVALLLATAAIACSTSASRAYVVVTLPPPLLTNGEGFDIAGGQVAVTTDSPPFPSGPTHAFLWTPSSGSLVDLQPPGFKSSATSGTNGVTQVGYGSLLPNGPTHAMRWSGSADTAEDINPDGATASQADGISADGQIVGEATLGGSTHAILWSGGDVIDLHPATGYTQTHAASTDGSHQVGGGAAPGAVGWQALVWSGSADSVVNLHPNGYATSAAMNLWGTQVVGYAGQAAPNDGQIVHAAIWDLATGTFADLNGDLVQSALLATNGSTQVGTIQTSADGIIHAALWYGTADSYVDLHALLPGNYNYSRATGIDADGNISGVAYNVDAGRFEAVAWLVPEPTGLAFLVAAALAVTRRRRQPGLATQVD